MERILIANVNDTYLALVFSICLLSGKLIIESAKFIESIRNRRNK